MDIIYRYEDTNNINIEKEYIKLLRDEFIAFYESMNSKKSIDEFTIKDYGVIILINNTVEFIKLIMNKSILQFDNLEINEVEEWLFELGKIFIIKFISSDDKLVEIFLEQKVYNELSYSYREEINKNIRVKRKFDGNKQIFK